MNTQKPVIRRVVLPMGTTKAFELDFNILIFGFGVGGGGIIHVATEAVKGKSQEDNTEKGVTVGYVLADDDPGDAFTVDVAMDSVYKTPVFRTVSGHPVALGNPRPPTGKATAWNSGMAVAR